MLAIIVVAGLAGATGGFIGWLASESNPRPGTTLIVSVGSDFSVTVNQSGVELHPADATYKCSLLYFMAIKVAVDDFDAMVAYMDAHPEYYFGYDNISTVLGDDQLQSAMTMEFVTDQLFSLNSDPGTDVELDGKHLTIDFGNYVVMLFFQIGIYYEAVFDTYSFGFEKNNDFIDAMNDENVNDAVMDEAVFLRGIDNTLAIKGMTIDVDDYTACAVDVSFNGVDMVLPFASL